jgi:hypothetical protein
MAKEDEQVQFAVKALYIDGAGFDKHQDFGLIRQVFQKSNFILT